MSDYGVIVMRGYGVKALHVLGLIWLWGCRYIEFSDFLKCFLRLRRNPEVLESNGLRIRFQRVKIYGHIIVSFFAQKFFFWACATCLKQHCIRNIALANHLVVVRFSYTDRFIKDSILACVP